MKQRQDAPETELNASEAGEEALRGIADFTIAPEVPREYYIIAQSRSSNALARKLTRRAGDDQLSMFGEAEFSDESFKLSISHYRELKNGISVSALKLLDILVIKATNAFLSDPLVKLTLKEFMSMRGLKDEKEARKQIKRDMEALDRVKFEYKGVGANKNSWMKVSLSGGYYGIVNSVLHYRFNEEFFTSLRIHDTKYLYMHIPTEAFKLPDNHHPYAYYLARRLAEHKRMNAGKSNEDIIAVKTLLEACVNMPKYEDLGEAKQVGTRIRGPFERDMDALGGTIKWHYAGENPETWEAFINATVQIEWHLYPNADNANLLK